MSVGTKHLAGQNVQRDKTSGRQDARIHNIHGTRHPWGQNVRRDKMFRDKMSVGTKCQET
jgi:hypothetical protein